MLKFVGFLPTLTTLGLECGNLLLRSCQSAQRVISICLHAHYLGQHRNLYRRVT